MSKVNNKKIKKQRYLQYDILGIYIYPKNFHYYLPLNFHNYSFKFLRVKTKDGNISDSFSEYSSSNIGIGHPLFLYHSRENEDLRMSAMTKAR